MVAEAAAKQCEMIVSHHPVIFDPLKKIGAQDVPFQLVQASPGVYKADLLIKDSEQLLGKLRLEIQVSNRVLPVPSQWAYHLYLWQNPFAVARYYQVPLWSQEHLDAMRPLMKMLADAGDVYKRQVDKQLPEDAHGFYETVCNTTGEFILQGYMELNRGNGDISVSYTHLLLMVLRLIYYRLPAGIRFTISLVAAIYILTPGYVV